MTVWGETREVKWAILCAAASTNNLNKLNIVPVDTIKTVWGETREVKWAILCAAARTSCRKEILKSQCPSVFSVFTTQNPV